MQLQWTLRVFLVSFATAASGCTTLRNFADTAQQIDQDFARARRMTHEGPGSSDIVNGRDVLPGTPDSKLAVMLLIIRESKLSVCTGVLVAHRVVLTAAHCVFNAEPKNVRVVFDTRDEKNPAVKDARGAKIRIHENYDGTPQSFSDLALVRLSADAPKDYLPAKLITSGDKILNDDIILVGFGITSEEKTDSRQLRKTTKSLKNDIHLKEKFLGIEQKSKSGGFCRGDSGAPVFATGESGRKLYGINSFTVGVEQNKECHTASVAMLIPYFADWISTNASAL